MMAIDIASSIEGLSVEGNDAVRRSYYGQTCMSKEKEGFHRRGRVRHDSTLHYP